MPRRTHRSLRPLLHPALERQPKLGPQLHFKVRPREPRDVKDEPAALQPPANGQQNLDSIAAAVHGRQTVQFDRVDLVFAEDASREIADFLQGEAHLASSVYRTRRDNFVTNACLGQRHRGDYVRERRRARNVARA